MLRQKLGRERARDCPRREKLNAIIAEDGENNRSEALTRANPLQLLNVIRAEATHKGLMYVELLTGGQKIVALVDSGAIHNFISTREPTKLSLKIQMDGVKVAAIREWPTPTKVTKL